MTDAAAKSVRSSAPDPRRVLVTGLGGASGNAAAIALRKRGFFVLGVDMNVVPNVADQFAQVPAPVDGSYPDVLRKLMGEHRIGWLIPTMAEEIVIVAEFAAELREQGIAVFISDPGPVSICHDKWKIAQAMHSHGILFASTADGGSGNRPVRTLNFPAVSRQGAAPATAGTEYDVLLVRHPNKPQHVIMCQVFEKTVLKGSGTTGSAVDVRSVDAPDVATLAMGAARALSLSGPIDMNIRRGNDGIPRLLEINARIGAHALEAPALFDVLVEMVQQGRRG